MIVDFEERRKVILSQIEERLAPLGARIYPDDELLERLAYNVEFPFVFQGSFPERYLDLPIEVLATAMREGQKLFSVVKDKKQLPVFLGSPTSPGTPRGSSARATSASSRRASRTPGSSGSRTSGNPWPKGRPG